MPPGRRSPAGSTLVLVLVLIWVVAVAEVVST